MRLAEANRAGSPDARQATKGIVIATDRARAVFAVETEGGRCAVFCQHSGPAVGAGDVVDGAVLSRGTQMLAHRDGICGVVGDSGPLSRQEALARIDAGPMDRPFSGPAEVNDR